MVLAYGKTDKGKSRENNQDNFAIQALGEDAMLAVVCDGMGGHNGGNIASRNAVNIISQHIASNYRESYDENSVRNMMLSAISVANALVHEMARRDDTLAGMGTTVVACVARGGMAHLMHAGDSRAYLWTEEGLTRVTRDHSVVQMLIESGELTEEAARTHPKKHYITRALGVDSELEADYGECPLREGQGLLLCTDGLTNPVSEQEILRVLRETAPEDAPAALVDLANEAGGPDNITAVLLCER